MSGFARVVAHSRVQLLSYHETLPSQRLVLKSRYGHALCLCFKEPRKRTPEGIPKFESLRQFFTTFFSSTRGRHGHS